MNESSQRFVYFFTLSLLPLVFVLLLGFQQTLITPNDQFFTNFKGAVPSLDTDTWTLKIDGEVQNPTTLTYDQFIARPTTKFIATLKCVEGYSGTAEWVGVRVKDLLDLAQYDSDAFDIIFYASDGYSSSLPIEEAIEDNIILAFKMNGEALPAVQGYPVRLVAPSYWGYKWVMWVVRIEVVNYDHRGFWEMRGWSDDAKYTSYSDWNFHAILFSITLTLGVVALMSGMKFSRKYDTFRDLPRFINRRFHITISLIYTGLLISILIFWFLQTFLLRGDILYTFHGYLALTTVGLQIGSVISGIRRSLRGPTRQYWHLKLTGYSFAFLIITISLGFLLFTGMGTIAK